MSNNSLAELPTKTNCFLDRTTVIYGATASGKTFVIKDIVNGLKNHIEQGIVVCPTENQHGTYTGGSTPMFSSALVHKDISGNLLGNIMVRQELMVAKYNKINNLANLSRVYSKYPSAKVDAAINELFSKMNQEVRAKKSTLSDDAYFIYNEECVKKLDGIKSKLYGQHINKNKPKFSTADAEDALIVNNIMFNPRILIIMDDVTEIMKESRNNIEISKLVTTGRHFFITFIFSLHTHAVVSPHIRSNAHISIFTDKKVANGYVDGNKQHMGKEDKKLMENYIFNVITGNDKDLPEEHRNRKLVFNALEGKYYAYRARILRPFQFVSPLIGAYMASVKK